MPALQPQSEITTLQQYESLPEDVRAEVFEGVIYSMVSPSQEHQALLLEFSTLLNAYVKDKNGPCRVFPAPFDVKLNDDPLTIAIFLTSKPNLSRNVALDTSISFI